MSNTWVRADRFCILNFTIYITPLILLAIVKKQINIVSGEISLYSTCLKQTNKQKVKIYAFNRMII